MLGKSHTRTQKNTKYLHKSNIQPQNNKMFVLQVNRTVASTNMNATSSRAHTIVGVRWGFILLSVFLHLIKQINVWGHFLVIQSFAFFIRNRYRGQVWEFFFSFQSFCLFASWDLFLRPGSPRSPRMPLARKWRRSLWSTLSTWLGGIRKSKE